MAYCNKDTLFHYLTNFTETQAPVKAVTCAFSSDAGAGMGLTVFSLIVFGGVGLGLTIRTQHPAPILVAGILTIGAAALSLGGQAMNIAMLVLFFGIAGLGLWLYARAQRSL